MASKDEARSSNRPGEPRRGEAFRVIKALADETRFEIYSIIQDSPTPLSVQQIAARVGLHPNTVRPHLEKLKESGLIKTETSLSGKVGRPVHLYSPTPKRPAALLGDKALRILRGVIAETLSELITTYKATPEDAYEMGRVWGRQIRNSAEFDGAKTGNSSKRPRSAEKNKAKAADSAFVLRRSEAVLSEDLELLGFEPSVENLEEGALVYFGDCPYRDLANSAPEIVCTVHKAICDESLRCAGEGVEVVEFNSIEAGKPCRARLSSAAVA